MLHALPIFNVNWPLALCALAIVCAVGALCNHIRGGWLNTLLHIKEDDTGAAMTVFGDIVGLFSRYGTASIFGFLMLCVQYGFNFSGYTFAMWYDGLWYALSLLAGHACCGWGEYIGALVRNKINTGHEVPQIDEEITAYLDRPILWGRIGLTWRGAMWGALLSFSFHSFIPLAAGFTMGLVYNFTIWLASGRDSTRANEANAAWGWAWGEFAFGAVLWPSGALALIVAGKTWMML